MGVSKSNAVRAIIVSGSSDIGSALCKRWVERGWSVAGTYRRKSGQVRILQKMGARFFPCDLSRKNSVQNACQRLKKEVGSWDVLVLCPGTQEPVGAFERCDFDKWEHSVRVNFLSQLRLLHSLLRFRSRRSRLGPCVLFFAGGGTNSAPVNYSAYTVSKIALIKMSELLDAEILDVRFTILGPGWVKTKIHRETLRAGKRAGRNFKTTREKLADGSCTPMERVLDCCDWLTRTPKRLIGGRNFSVVYDRWGDKSLEKKLETEPHFYKLRRYGNEWFA